MYYVKIYYIDQRRYSSRSVTQICWQYFTKMAMQLLVHNLMPHLPEMLAMMHVLPRLARQARASASNGATCSTDQISSILARRCLVKDDTVLGTLPAAGASFHYHTSSTDDNCLACSRVGTRSSSRETNAVRWNLIINMVLTRSLDV